MQFELFTTIEKDDSQESQETEEGRIHGGYQARPCAWCHDALKDTIQKGFRGDYQSNILPLIQLATHDCSNGEYDIGMCGYSRKFLTLAYVRKLSLLGVTEAVVLDARCSGQDNKQGESSYQDVHYLLAAFQLAKEMGAYVE